MIRSFRHKGLKRLFEENDARGLNVEHTEKLRRILARMDSAKALADMDLPGYRLHALKRFARLLFRDGSGQLAGDLPLCGP